VTRRLLAGLAVAGLLAGCAPGRPGPPAASLGTVVDTAVPAAIRNLPLVTADGRPTSLAAFGGRDVMIADFLSLCTDVCPLTSANTAAMARAVTAAALGARVVLLEISVDPERDTPARLRAYQRLYGGPQADWVLLTETPANAAVLWRYFGVAVARAPEPKPATLDWLTHRPLTYDVDHSNVLVFLGPDGAERFVVNAAPDTLGAVPPGPLVGALSPQGRNDLAHPDPVVSWTVPQALSVLSWLAGRKIPVAGG